jgi:hypothetical protein
MPHFSDLTVLTGDIIKSSDLPAHELDAAFARLHSLVSWLSDHHSGHVWFERFRGDGWQIAIETPEIVPLALSLIWSELHGHGLKTRISVAQGEGTIRGSLGSANGPVFVESGRGLEELDGNESLHVSSSCSESWRVLFPALDFISGGWTVRQAQVCGAALRTWPMALNVSALARDLGAKRQTVQKHLDSSGYAAFHSAISVFYPFSEL